MQLEDLKTVSKTIGAKQTAKGIERGQMAYVYVGSDADARIIAPIITLCQKYAVAVDDAHTMEELGKAAAIKVKAAAVGVLK